MHVAYVLVFLLGFVLRFYYTVLAWLIFYIFYVQVTVHRDKLCIKHDASNIQNLIL